MLASSEQAYDPTTTSNATSCLKTGTVHIKLGQDSNSAPASILDNFPDIIVRVKRSVVSCAVHAARGELWVSGAFK
jgi:hypothetical protein